MSMRKNQLDRIAALLTDNFNVALHAAPRTGKTWLADETLRRIESEALTVLRMDMSVERDGRDVFVRILESLGSASSPAKADIYAIWRQLRAALESSSASLTIVLDEFDEVLRYPDSLDFLKLLRELIHRPWKTNASCFIISRRPLESIESEVRGISTLATLCVQEYMGALGRDDLRELWPAAAGLSDAEQSDCLNWSSGYPPLVRYWLSTRPDRNPSPAAEHEQILEFDRLLNHLELLGLRDASAQLVLGPVIDDWLLERQHLQVLGVLAADEAGPTFGEHEIFRSGLRLRTWSLDPWGSLGLAEVRLRGLIEEILGEHFGVDWASSGATDKIRPIQNAFKEAEHKVEQDRQRFGRSGAWLAYTYPQDLSEIILATWDQFKGVFSDGDKTYWRSRFTALASYRTPVAHNRAEVLSHEQRTQCRLFAEEVLRAISRYQESRQRM